MDFLDSFSWISHGFLMDFLRISCGYPMDFLWVLFLTDSSHGSPMDFICDFVWFYMISHGLPMAIGFLWVFYECPYGCRMDFLWIPMGFLWTSIAIPYAFPMVFLWIPFGFPMDVLTVPYEFPMGFLWFPI